LEKVIHTRGYWGFDSNSILFTPSSDNASTFRIIKSVGDKEQDVAMLPSKSKEIGAIFQGNSPDGKFLSICQYKEQTNGGYQQEFQNLLYDVNLNRWLLLSKGSSTEGRRCGVTLGWL
jgi:Tol biopolymer transport system component